MILDRIEISLWAGQFAEKLNKVNIKEDDKSVGKKFAKKFAGGQCGC
jgi:hypothetical protein